MDTRFKPAFKGEKMKLVSMCGTDPLYDLEMDRATIEHGDMDTRFKPAFKGEKMKLVSMCGTDPLLDTRFKPAFKGEKMKLVSMCGTDPLFETEQVYIRSPRGKFVPVYNVVWTKKRSTGKDSLASVRLFTPTRKLLHLRVEDQKYILRKPIAFTNLEQLISSP